MRTINSSNTASMPAAPAEVIVDWAKMMGSQIGITDYSEGKIEEALQNAE